MTDEELELKRAEMLFDYTKFHIGLYATIAALLVTVLTSDFAEGWNICEPLVWVAVVAIVLAGACGGLVASNLPQHAGTIGFLDKPVGPLWSEGLGSDRPSIKCWASYEHAFFWLAVILTIVAFALASCSKPEPKSVTTPLTIRGTTTITVTR